MKRSDLKELIKKSMLEVSPTSGAMTPEEEKMVADYEEEEANKYALDKEEPMEEDVLREADEIVAAWAQKQTLSEEGILGATTVGGGETSTVKTDPTSQALLGAIAKMSDSYLALANHINKTYPQAFSDPKVSMYMNGLAQEIKNLKQLKQGLKEADLSQANFSDLHQVIKNIAHVNEVGMEEAAMQAIEYIAEQFDVPVDFKDF